MLQGVFSRRLFSSTLAGSLHVVLRGLLIGLVTLSLMACSGSRAAPPESVIEQALVRQFAQTQQALRQQLSSSEAPPLDFQISHVKVNRTEQTSDDLGAYRIQGTYTLSGKSLSHSLRQARNPFEIYLQSQDKGQTWSLLPKKGE